jgi:hypothetical protein
MVKKEYVRRLRLILSTEESTKNAIRTLAISVLRYSFRIINWYQEEI